MPNPTVIYKAIKYIQIKYWVYKDNTNPLFINIYSFGIWFNVRQSIPVPIVKINKYLVVYIWENIRQSPKFCRYGQLFCFIFFGGGGDGPWCTTKMTHYWKSVDKIEIKSKLFSFFSHLFLFKFKNYPWILYSKRWIGPWLLYSYFDLPISYVK